MKCFSYHDGEVTTGFQVSQDDKLGNIVFLGQDGKGGRFEKIAVDSSNPVQIKNGLIEYAKFRPFYVNKKNYRRKYILLSDPSLSRDVVFLRVNTSTPDKGKTRGSWFSVNGNPKKIAEAFGCYNGNGPRFSDDLITMNHDDTITIIPAGRGNKRMVIKNVNGSLVCITQAEYRKEIRASKAKVRDVDEQVGCEVDQVGDEIEQQEEHLTPEEASAALDKLVPDPFDSDEPEEEETGSPEEVLTHTPDGEVSEEQQPA